MLHSYSLKEVENVANLLRVADPPLVVNVFDNKKGELLNI